MVEIAFANSAWEDLDAITNYIALDSPRYAQEFADRVIDHVEQLIEFPESGRIVPEFSNSGLRELILDSYRIVYRIMNSRTIVDLRIVHGSKLLK